MSDSHVEHVPRQVWVSLGVHEIGDQKRGKKVISPVRSWRLDPAGGPVPRRVEEVVLRQECARQVRVDDVLGGLDLFPVG